MFNCDICGERLPDHKPECVYTDIVKVLPISNAFPSTSKVIQDIVARDNERHLSYESGRLLHEIEREIRNCSQLIGSPNDETTRRTLAVQIERYMTGLMQRGAVQNFRVICDATNNGPSDIDSHQLNVEVVWRPRATLDYMILKGVVKQR